MGTTELIADDDTVWAARQVAAELPAGAIKLDDVHTPLPEAIATLLRNILDSVALGKSVSVVVGDPKTDQAPMELIDTLIADGKILLDWACHRTTNPYPDRCKGCPERQPALSYHDPLPPNQPFRAKHVRTVPDEGDPSLA